MLPYPLLLLAAQLAGSAGTVANSVTIGDVVKLRSQVLNEDRTLFIAKPADYDKGTERYPVVYVLDGETQFRSSSAVVAFLADAERIPPMLVVGIASGSFAQRSYDLTPKSTAELDNRFLPNNGGANAFLTFIKTELIPYVERSYRTRPARLLIGHSFGGLFALHALMSEPELFTGIVAIDPSLSWNDGAVVNQAQSFFKHMKELQVDLYLTASNAAGTVPAGARRFAAILSTKRPRWASGLPSSG